MSGHQGAKQIQYEGKRGDSMASENTELLKKDTTELNEGWAHQKNISMYNTEMLNS